MPDIRLSRDFPIAQMALFELVSTRAGILQWFGHEDTTIPEHELDFSRLGPWFSVLENREGRRFRMSGQVTHVRPPESLGFTWAFHDDAGARGAESHVTFTVAATPGGARLTIDHRDLPTQEMAASHKAGWTVGLTRIAHIAVPE